LIRFSVISTNIPEITESLKKSSDSGMGGGDIFR
jgi:hypothetical protein